MPYLMYTKYNTIMTVGIYTENIKDEESKEIYNGILEIIQEYEYVLQIHGFYHDKNKKIINFDLVISFDDDNPHDTIKKIKEETSNKNLGYTVIINNDQDFTLS